MNDLTRLFTDRARRVMQLANQEAQRINHSIISSEDVLVGLIREGSGVAWHTLKQFGLDVEKIRQAIAKSNIAPTTDNQEVSQIIECARQEMLLLGHNYIGTEHLLLGLIKSNAAVTSIAHVILKDYLGVNIGEMRDYIIECIVAPYEFKLRMIDLPRPGIFIEDFKKFLATQMELPEEFKNMDMDSIITVIIKRKLAATPV